MPPRNRADGDPAHVLRGFVVREPVKLADAKSTTEIAVLLRGLDSYAGARTKMIAIWLLLLRLCGPAKMRNAPWSEFDLDRKL